MRRTLCLVTAALGLGCSTVNSGLPVHNAANVSLNRANYRVVKANARGSDVGFRLLGLIPIVSPSVADAMDDLMSTVDSEGRAIALVNVAEERGTIYLILFSLPRIEVRAEVIEFLDQ